MLYLYQSNRLEALSEFLAAFSSAVPLSDPFVAETVIVQSRGMGRWISLDLAKKNGVAANLEFVLPAAFAWRLMQRVIPGLPKKSFFSPDVLAWRLMEWLPMLSDPVFAPLQRYLAGGEAAAFELAGKIADVYDQYLVFRPDWIRAWEAGQLLDLGEDEAWQAALWKQLAEADDARHRVRMLDEVLAGLRPEHVPERVVLFGIASLAPMYLALVKRLAEITDVLMFALNPSEMAWGDIVDARRALALGENAADAAGHPLLASLGKQGRDFFDLLVAECANELKDLFVEPAPQTLLGRLQYDLLTLSNPQSPDYEHLAMDGSDNSVEVHVAHGPMRELEILKDRLLARFAADPTLTPADVAVLTPDINTYAPFIHAVFGRRDDAPSLPYSVADRRVSREHPLLSTFAALLELADSRFEAERLLALLDCAALQRRFNLSTDELPFLRRWVRDAAIRWGRDAAHKAGLGLPADAAFSWRQGLDRLLLGTVLPPELLGDGTPLFEGLLPLAGASGSLADTLAALVALFDALAGLAEQWAVPASPADWAARCHAAIEALFEPDDEDEAALSLLRDALAELAGDAELAGFGQPVGLAVLRDWLARRLTLSVDSGFLTGGVTFCAMVPMRSLPFRVLCLVGMNDGVYPRDERPVSFDLIARHPRRGDRSRRFDDRYLFLEALLSAREALYLSYVGRSARSDEPLPPSALLSELLDCFAAMAGEGVRDTLVTAHPLQPFSPRYYDASSPRLFSYEPAYAAALAAERHEPVPFATHLLLAETPRVLPWPDLLRFWQNPARAWLADRLGIRVAREEDELPEREPFALDRDGRERVRGALLEGRLAGAANDATATRLRAAGALPPGELGEAWLAAEQDATRRLLRQLPAALFEPPLPPWPFSLDIAGLTLTGTLSGLRRDGQYLVKVRRAFAGEKIGLWLQHLLLNALAPDGFATESTLLDDEGRLTLAPLPPAEAQALLAPWLEGWLVGQENPLPFFPRTSWAAAVSLADAKLAREAALTAAQNEWAPAFDGNGKVAQRDDPAIALAFRHVDPLADPVFLDWAERLLLPLLAAFQQAEEGDA
ncbi:exodeoxyribonuclease V subunit gamma [Crenobacter sp. SG2305]|uniref:exodeoxyribonuclease V subunit gamma n=1 Tax=Crenobacter oryzisoli TaxID=3056844 RepID=UPI0025AB1BC1|nr:exodeoxyribonuclease V subunit gamma [Crenobacter sp. SG2305]MDN0082101.1 exodeoxyribonuclease V subunit gamma [Crenobacter sp. SG2305]